MRFIMALHLLSLYLSRVTDLANTAIIPTSLLTCADTEFIFFYLKALLKMGIRGVTVSDVKGFGAQGGSTERQGGK